jgi:hypothetical protein
MEHLWNIKLDEKLSQLAELLSSLQKHKQEKIFDFKIAKMQI